jgi:hypothetical protein
VKERMENKKQIFILEKLQFHPKVSEIVISVKKNLEKLIPFIPFFLSIKIIYIFKPT